MEQDARHPADDSAIDASADGYQPPLVTHLGSVADLTRQKEVGAADGEQFLGLDIGS